ncbi:MAG TPA: DUF72 domain-containing protein [Thermoanaerobaculia bacterium]|nr:DUF72 domain-containing protein [Thermoanaerobaculia bacterium]
MTRLYAGTSGFSYAEWKGSFYPEDLPSSKFLSYYAERLAAVEINNTFYRMPKASMLEGWRDAVGDDFRFVLKVSQRITHKQRLVDCGDAVRYLLDTSCVLGEKRGPFLVQLPPYLRKDAERLRAFLAEWPRDVPAAYEFRHASWFDDETLDLLREAGMALCVADNDTDDEAKDGGGGQAASPVERTADWAYIRLRRQDYDDEALRAWCDRVRALGCDRAFVFFKHEDEGAGPRLARRFAELFERAEPEPAGRGA